MCGAVVEMGVSLWLFALYRWSHWILAVCTRIAHAAAACVAHLSENRDTLGEIAERERERAKSAKGKEEEQKTRQLLVATDSPREESENNARARGGVGGGVNECSCVAGD